MHGTFKTKLLLDFSRCVSVCVIFAIFNSQAIRMCHILFFSFCSFNELVNKVIVRQNLFTFTIVCYIVGLFILKDYFAATADESMAWIWGLTKAADSHNNCFQKQRHAKRKNGIKCIMQIFFN